MNGGTLAAIQLDHLACTLDRVQLLELMLLKTRLQYAVHIVESEIRARPDAARPTVYTDPLPEDR
jgi:hypothetical protein